MSCKHGNHPDACDICEEVDAAYKSGVAGGSRAAPSVASAAKGDEVPPLPKAVVTTDMHIDGKGHPAFTAEQMRDYASAAIAAASQQAAQPKAAMPNMDDWNVQMVCVKALLSCTEGELECIGEKLLDSYIGDVTRVVAAALAAAGVSLEAK